MIGHALRNRQARMKCSVTMHGSMHYVTRHACTKRMCSGSGLGHRRHAVGPRRGGGGRVCMRQWEHPVRLFCESSGGGQGLVIIRGGHGQGGLLLLQP